ncbi:MAG TPA: hypothetical protein PK912_08220, partial [Microthrixaceae bacterium]|nr:hypothetical protein [Microthrixaceae bacterium]
MRTEIVVMDMAGTTVSDDGLELRISRRLAAPPALVFRCFTQAEHLRSLVAVANPHGQKGPHRIRRRRIPLAGLLAQQPIHDGL